MVGSCRLLATLGWRRCLHMYAYAMSLKRNGTKRYYTWIMHLSFRLLHPVVKVQTVIGMGMTTIIQSSTTASKRLRSPTRPEDYFFFFLPRVPEVEAPRPRGPLVLRLIPFPPPRVGLDDTDAAGKGLTWKIVRIGCKSTHLGSSLVPLRPRHTPSRHPSQWPHSLASASHSRPRSPASARCCRSPHRPVLR